MKRPWMPLYVGDYLGDTGHLTTAQHGAYLLLMMHYWRKGELPDEDGQLAAITGFTIREWRRHREILNAFFFDGWHHKRIDDELQKMLRTSKGRSIAGFKGGIRSAMARMTLEDGAGRQANAKQSSTNCLNSAEARVDHSHSQSKKEEASKGGLTISPELAAIMARKVRA